MRCDRLPSCFFLALVTASAAAVACTVYDEQLLAGETDGGNHMVFDSGSSGAGGHSADGGAVDADGPHNTVGCSFDADCDGQRCIGGRCVPASCHNGWIDPGETATDCGGPECGACEDGAACTRASDCASGVCDEDVCAAPSCDDSVQNADETGVDCGGGCKPCADGASCKDAEDCVSGVCIDKTCRPGTCKDGIKNGDETDRDCGGDACAACPTDAACAHDSDCQSNVCDADVCQAPACDDERANGSETDVDCGGTCENKCAIDQLCKKAADCESNHCVEGACSCSFVVELESVADAHIDATNSTENFGSSASLTVTQYTVAYSKRALVRFDTLTAIPEGAVVDGAELELTATSVSHDFQVSLHRVQQNPQRPWVEAETTWSAYAAAGSWSNAGGDFALEASDMTAVTSASSATRYSWDVSADVAHFHQFPETNFGWVVRGQDDAGVGQTAQFAARESSQGPRLRVHYSTCED